MNKKGFITIYISGFILAVVIVLIAAVLAPAGALFTAKAVEAGDRILLQANESIQGISNDTIKGSIMQSIGNANNAAVMNIDITTDMFQYMWIIVLIIVAIVLFLISRQIVEVGRGGFI